MRRIIHHLLPLVLIVLAVSLACDDDENNPTGTGGASTGSVSGTVTFEGTWPSAGNVQVSVYTNLSAPWIPMGPPEAFTDPIAGPVGQYDFKLEGLDKADYCAIYVGWRDPASPMDARLIGMYWVFADSVGISSQTGLPVAEPTGFTIDNGNLNMTGLDITADLDLAN